MTSVLNVDTIADKAGTGPVELTKQSAAKAFIVGTDAAGITNSLNVGSGTDNGIGNYSYSYVNNMANSNWCFAGSSEAAARMLTLDVASVAKDSNGFDVRLYVHNGNEDDRSHGGQIHGDLA
jgi:hypothetical protein